MNNGEETKSILSRLGLITTKKGSVSDGDEDYDSTGAITWMIENYKTNALANILYHCVVYCCGCL